MIALLPSVGSFDMEKGEIGFRFGEIENVPKEVTSQIVALKLDNVQSEILEIVEYLGGIATLDEILIWLYHKTKTVYKREKISGKLYRLCKDHRLVSVEGKKSTYTVPGYKEPETSPSTPAPVEGSNSTPVDPDL